MKFIPSYFRVLVNTYRFLFKLDAIQRSLKKVVANNRFLYGLVVKMKDYLSGKKYSGKPRFSGKI